MIDRALSILARLSLLLAPLERRPDLFPIPVRQDVRHDRRR